MIFHRLPLMTLGLILAGGLLAAQDSDTPRQEGERDTRTRAEDTTRRERQATTAESEAGAAATEQDPAARRDRVSERVRRASRLPRTTEQAREAGVPEERVRETIRVVRERGIPADEAQEIIEVETEEVRQGGNPDNFGSFVQQAKESGLRGRELAEAIHAEQIARGMKKPKTGSDTDRGHSKGKGRDKNAGKKGGIQ
jgi:hypothetical protein